MLGVHANTVRAWTDQGRLRCLRINERGDRRYSMVELESFLQRARRASPPADDAGAETEPVHEAGPNIAGLLRQLAALSADQAQVEQRGEPELGPVAELLGEAGYIDVTFLPAFGSPLPLRGEPVDDEQLARRARRTRMPVVGGRTADGKRELAVPVGDAPALSLLQLRRSEPGRLAVPQELDFLATFAAQLGGMLILRQRSRQLEGERRRAHILQAVSSDISSQLDLGRILNQLLGYATELFGAQHAGVLRSLPTGSYTVDQAFNLSSEFRQAIEHAPSLPLMKEAFEEGRVVSAANYAEDFRAAPLRRALRREGVNTVTAAPLVSDGEPLGALVLYHDESYAWGADDLALLEQLARMGAVALGNARNYSRMATWAAQLQSIQQLGARLTRLSSVHDIGQAIATELNQLIDYHNVRVYRIEDDEVVPVAWRGEVGEYTGEDGVQLRVKVGQGITGWVARFGVAQYLPDAAADRRTETIPGTEDDLDESLLLAPMLYEDEVIGVIVLAKLGLHQFTSDDLRLLEIYASIAAQAMANADVAEKLRGQSEALARQLQSQRELLRVTESILSTLDAPELLDGIAVRLGTLLQVDNVAVHLRDEQTGMVRPIFARGVHAAQYMASPYASDVGLSALVLRSGEPALVQDVLADKRIVHFADVGPQPGAVIIAPLRSRGRVSGLITIHRLGEDARFSEEEFELVKLFAGHASIALNNAETHRAVELRAESDPLTGLKNHGTLIDHLDHAVGREDVFSLLMIDLDNFKDYNDARGHEAGNVMLRRLANALRAACRDSDEVFRYGGDEFAIILPATSPAGAQRVAEKVRSAVRSTHQGRGSARITCSIGIASYPEDAAERSSLLLAADRACYAAKRKGRDRSATAADGVALAGALDMELPLVHEPADNYSAA